MNPYVYSVRVGTREVFLYGHDDRTVRRWLACYLGVVWPRHVAHTAVNFPGSMEHASCEGWHGQWHEASIWRARLLPADIIPINGWVRIDGLEMSPEPIAEFRRVYRGR